MSDSVRPHRQQPARLPHPWDSPGKNTGVGCHLIGPYNYTQNDDPEINYAQKKARISISNFRNIKKKSASCNKVEKEMATYSGVLAWRIPGMGKPGGLPSLGSHRVGHDWGDLAAAA